jgi:hypothetical protein
MERFNYARKKAAAHSHTVEPDQSLGCHIGACPSQRYRPIADHITRAGGG